MDSIVLAIVTAQVVVECCHFMRNKKQQLKLNHHEQFRVLNLLLKPTKPSARSLWLFGPTIAPIRKSAIATSRMMSNPIWA